MHVVEEGIHIYAGDQNHGAETGLEQYTCWTGVYVGAVKNTEE